MRPFFALVLASAMAFPLAACSTYRDDLLRSQTAFEQNNHERALAILRSLEPNTARLDDSERARYAYLRGMTDYRIGYRWDARHWLLLAESMENESHGLLPEDWRGRLGEALLDLNGVVYKSGTEALTNSAQAKSPPAETPKRKRESNRPAEKQPAESEDEP